MTSAPYSKTPAWLLCATLLFGLSACSGDDVEQDDGPRRCLLGDAPHPITGLCKEEEEEDKKFDMGSAEEPNVDLGTTDCPEGESFDVSQGRCFPERAGVDMPGDLDVSSDMGADLSDDADMPTTDLGPIDMEALRCAAGIDSDGDGLDNDCECSYGSDPMLADTDGDGLTDGEEDANKDCRPVGEPDARTADTDGDGVSDFDEVTGMLDPLTLDTDVDGIPDGVEFLGCTDPLKPDTDGDGLDDGLEDGNKDGEIGACPNRMYAAACAAGESDPCKVDTDGNGTPDQDELIYRTCRPSDTQNLVQPQLLVSMNGDYQLATEVNVTASPVTSAGGSVVSAHVFEDITHHYTGFVLTMASPPGSAEAFQLSDHVFNQVLATPAYASASRRSAGRQITTHDGFKASVDATVDLPADVSPAQVRDDLLATLTGVGDLTHSLMGSIDVVPGESSLLKYEVIARSPQEYVVVVTVAPLGKAEDPTLETGFRSDDLTGGSSVAASTEQLEADCISHKVTERPQVDIIISMDASGSMQDEQMALANFVQDLTGFLDAANLDWRIGVTSVACDNISQDGALSPEFRALFPMGGGFFDLSPCSLPGGLGGGGSGNGSLVKGSAAEPGFSRDSAQIAARINDVNGTNSEFTLTMGIAAVERALPRSDSNADKIREDAAVVIIAVTDEEDELFKSNLMFLPKEDLTPAERMQLDTETAPFVDYLLDPTVGATVFGLYNVPNSDCDTAAQFASGIHDVVNKTGGTGGSICQADITTSLQAIASATAGIASGLRLRGAPVSPSIDVTHAQIMTGMEIPMTRSRLDGFDFDGIVNRVAFYGPNAPVTNDRLIIPYLRWSNSVAACMTEDDCPGEQKFKCVNNECR